MNELNPSRTSSTDETSIPEKQTQAQWHDETAESSREPDLRERVRELTARALHEKRMDLENIREIVGAVTSGVGSGLTTRQGEIKAGLKQAVSGFDDAVSSVAQAASYTVREAVEQGRSFKDNELKAGLTQLRGLESQLVDTLKHMASESSGKLKEELGYLSDHLKYSGARTGDQVRDALQQLTQGVKAGSEAGRAGLSETASAATDRLSQVASGVLSALSDSLKRQSDRMRP